MSYVALYRKFRPQKFSDVVGQEHVTTTLKNQILNNRIGHAYLFNGGRGSGKTSTAKILSRAVNCLNPQDGEPCNCCDVCKGILDGSIMDVIEMDAASNNGVDNIRDIREEVEYLPSKAKYRVYIIDEVHMLSTGAFNALLKTLEEPPAHVIFILATTEPQKIPLTILSRCQRFEFKKISIGNIKKILNHICDEIGIKIEDSAARIIANMSGGAARDAISVLDRCVSDGDSVITEEKIRELVGVPPFEYLCSMCESIINYDEDNTLINVQSIIKEGKDLEVFTLELIKMIRDMLIIKTCGTLESYEEEDLLKLKQIVSKVDKHRLLELVTLLSDLSVKMKYATNEEIMFEVGMLKLCLKDETKNILETKKINTGTSDSTTETRKILNLKNDDSFQGRVLTKLKENGKMLIHMYLTSSKIEKIDDSMVHIIFENETDNLKRTMLQKEESKMAVKEAVVAAVGKDISVRYIFEK